MTCPKHSQSTTVVTRLKLRLYGGKSKCHPPTRATLGEPTFPIFPHKRWGTVYMRNKKAGLARRVRTRLARFLFCDGKVTILAGPSFLRINTLARILDPSAPHAVEIAPSRVNLVTWLRRDNQSMRTCCFTQSRQVRVLLARATEVVQFFSHIDARSS